MRNYSDDLIVNFLCCQKRHQIIVNNKISCFNVVSNIPRFNYVIDVNRVFMSVYFNDHVKLFINLYVFISFPYFLNDTLPNRNYVYALIALNNTICDKLYFPCM